MKTEVLTKFKRYCDSASDYTETLTIRNEFSTELLDLRRELIYEIDSNLISDSAPHKIESYINEVKEYAELILTGIIKEFEDAEYRPDVRNWDDFFKEIQDDLKLVGETLITYCDKSLKRIQPVEKSNEKIKWLGSPEQFGYIFGELAAKGYVELPTKETEGSFSKLAELCLSYFEILSTKGKTAGKQTTIENLERAINPETNRLNVKGKAGLKLPPLKDLK